MKDFHNPFVQIRNILPTLVSIAAVSAILLGGVLVLHFWKGLSFSELTCDPLSLLGMPIYVGFLSQIGIFIWAATASISLFTALVLTGQSDIPRLKHFLLVSGIMSLWLGFDDVFILHEKFFPRIGVPQDLVLASYVGIALLWAAGFRRTIAKTEYLLLGTALLFFASSVAQDIFGPKFETRHFYEDGAKLIALLSWLAYFSRLCLSGVRQKLAQ